MELLTDEVAKSGSLLEREIKSKNPTWCHILIKIQYLNKSQMKNIQSKALSCKSGEHFLHKDPGE